MTPRDNRCHKSYCYPRRSPHRSPHRPKQTDPTHAPVGFASARKNSRLLTTKGSHNIGLTPCQPADLPMKLLASKRMRNATAPFKPPQKVVTEWELDSHLAEGWKYIATLPSGRIIVEN